MTIDPPPSLLLRVRSEYLEMPGLKLTPWQAARLLGVEPAASERALMSLVNSGFLLRTKDGKYLRTSLR
jgi:DNA-binding IclR family transcriptional regulator